MTRFFVGILYGLIGMHVNADISRYIRYNVVDLFLQSSIVGVQYLKMNYRILSEKLKTKIVTNLYKRIFICLCDIVRLKYVLITISNFK